MERSSWDCDGLDWDAIEFKVDKDIILSGLRLFGKVRATYTTYIH